MAFSATIAQRGLNSPFEELIRIAAQNYGVEVALIKAIISQESAWDAGAVNLSDPSYGLMQLNYNYFKMPDGSPILDPTANIDTGTKLLRDLKRFGSLDNIISAYNAGHPITGNITNYVIPVKQYRDWFLANDVGGGGDHGNGGDPDWGMADGDLKMMAALVVGGLLIFALLRR